MTAAGTRNRTRANRENRQEQLKLADWEGQIAAINKSQAVCEFEMDGTIITANENFLGVMGYELDEIKGRHHSMFVEPGEQQSAEYKEFWQRLNHGEYAAAEFHRLGKGGKEVWIQASYNPILDLNGKPYKVVKYSTDITKEVEARKENRRLSKVFTDAADAIIIEISTESWLTPTELSKATMAGHGRNLLGGRSRRSFRRNYTLKQTHCCGTA